MIIYTSSNSVSIIDAVKLILSFDDGQYPDVVKIEKDANGTSIYYFTEEVAENLSQRKNKK